MSQSKSNILSLIRIFVAEYLSNVQFFAGFSKQAINIISIYIYQLVYTVAIDAKEVVSSLQGRQMPNVLHLLFILMKTRTIVKAENFLTYIKNKSLKRFKQPFPNLMLENMLSKNGYCWEKGKSEAKFQNIQFIPEKYIEGLKINEKNHFSPYFQTVDNSFQLPSSYTYLSNNHEKTRIQKDPNFYRLEVEREMASQMRKYKKINKNEEQQVEKEEKYTAVESDFKFIKYI